MGLADLNNSVETLLLDENVEVHPDDIEMLFDEDRIELTNNMYVNEERRR